MLITVFTETNSSRLSTEYTPSPIQMGADGNLQHAGIPLDQIGAHLLVVYVQQPIVGTPLCQPAGRLNHGRHARGTHVGVHKRILDDAAILERALGARRIHDRTRCWSKSSFGLGLRYRTGDCFVFSQMVRLMVSNGKRVITIAGFFRIQSQIHFKH
jgi:hypothetical protein